MRVARKFVSITLATALAAAPAAAQSTARAPTVADARRFIEAAERDLFDLSIKANQAAWVAVNFITDDTEALNAEHSKNLAVAIQRYAMQAKRFEKLQLPAELRRKLTLLKLALSAPPPGNPSDAAELTKLTTSMEADYGKGTYCRQATPPQCLQINDLSKIMATSTNPAELLDVWQGWHRVGAPLRPRYARFVELSNKGARELGFANTGELWRAGYDMTPAEFARELDRLWEQVRPLYQSLHAYVRTKLAERYGTALVPPNGMIPAHLLGNMWAQEWGNIYPLVAPVGLGDPGFDITERIKTKGVTQDSMVRIAEGFFTSLGLQKLPATFWERSLIVKPRDREVVCHASAWSIDNKDDVRIKMCTEQTGEDLVTVHHELGHNYYYLAYKHQPILFQGGANDGFHEAIGDAIALSITPEYLKTIGLIDQLPSVAADTMLLLRQALDKVAFLPFGLLIDQWRWKVFGGEVTPANYNAAWWDLRNRYQGVSAPLARSEADFDPGAKYHIPANTPYSRYFLARVLQFQFYRAMCREAGWTGPLYRCTFYGNKNAGAKLQAMLQLGSSTPWPEALYAMTGERRMDAGALAEYFQPLKVWLDEQNRGKTIGWTP
ncbi:MAG: M2 family metallopeptidase [Gemmatimonadaceae bacterium]